MSTIRILLALVTCGIGVYIGQSAIRMASRQHRMEPLCVGGVLMLVELGCAYLLMKGLD